MTYRCLWCDTTTKSYKAFAKHHKSTHPDEPVRVRYEGKAYATYNGSKTLKLYVPAGALQLLGVENPRSYTITITHSTMAQRCLILRLYPL